jgi:hypothetical protein
MTTKSAFPAPGVPMSLARMHGSPRVEELALPKSVETDNLSPNRIVIRGMSGEIGCERRRGRNASRCLAGLREATEETPRN